MSPDSIFRAVWDISLFVTIIYQCISLPMRVSFEMSTTDFSYYLEIIIDVMFITDILINFNTGFYLKNQVIMRRALIAKEYFKLWFWLDLISSIPFTWILAWSQGIKLRDVENDDSQSIANSVIVDAPQFLKLLKISKLLKMLKLLRMVKIKRLMRKFEEYIVTDSIDLLVTFFNIIVKIIVYIFLNFLWIYNKLINLYNFDSHYRISQTTTASRPLIAKAIKK